MGKKRNPSSTGRHQVGLISWYIFLSFSCLICLHFQKFWIINFWPERKDPKNSWFCINFNNTKEKKNLISKRANSGSVWFFEQGFFFASLDRCYVPKTRSFQSWKWNWIQSQIILVKFLHLSAAAWFFSVIHCMLVVMSLFAGEVQLKGVAYYYLGQKKNMFVCPPRPTVKCQKIWVGILGFFFFFFKDLKYENSPFSTENV